MSENRIEGLVTRDQLDAIKFDELGGFEVTNERLLELVGAGAKTTEEPGGAVTGDINIFCPITNSGKGCGDSPEGSS